MQQDTQYCKCWQYGDSLSGSAALSQTAGFLFSLFLTYLLWYKRYPSSSNFTAATDVQLIAQGKIGIKALLISYCRQQGRFSYQLNDFHKTSYVLHLASASFLYAGILKTVHNGELGCKLCHRYHDRCCV